MKKWNMIIDVEKCENCYNCFLAAKDEYVGNEHKGYTVAQPEHGHNWVDLERKERGQWPMVEANFRPVMCNHCDDAPCMDAAKDGAITKREDGIVIIDPIKSKGQKQIVGACPYNAIYWNEEHQVPQAWIFDSHLLDNGWRKTRLEQVCPTKVFKSLKVTDEEMQDIAKRDGLQTLEPKRGAKPRVYYKNNHLFDSAFIGGTVVTNDAGQEDCVFGAKVTAHKDGTEIGAATTDAYGDFKIDKLEPNAGAITLRIEAPEKAITEQTVDLTDSIYVGVIEVA